MALVRRASHSGSWYSSNKNVLNGELSRWLGEVDKTHTPARAIISPHAGYTYSGATAAYSFKQIKPDNVKTIFILGPSHHVHIRGGCALTQTSIYKTPLGDLEIDENLNKTLESSGSFERMSVQVDEDEHSIEMQLPYIYKIMEGNTSFKIVPVLVGHLNEKQHASYGKIFAPYLADPNNIFVISSDFCHWGKRFRYTYYDESHGEIYQSIEHLDMMGVKLIENLDAQGFAKYLEKHENTICGRNPISIMLHTINEIQRTKSNIAIDCRFLKYAQSSKVRDMRDSSVSYVAISCTMN